MVCLASLEMPAGYVFLHTSTVRTYSMYVLYVLMYSIYPHV